jgi:hypothetical protein
MRVKNVEPQSRQIEYPRREILSNASTCLKYGANGEQAEKRGRCDRSRHNRRLTPVLKTIGDRCIQSAFSKPPV